jgi:hypothetical protein
MAGDAKCVVAPERVRAGYMTMVEATSRAAACFALEISPSVGTKIEFRSPLRNGSIAHLEGKLFPTKEMAESPTALDEMSVLLEVKALLVEVRALIAPFIAERASELAAGQVAA